MVQGLSNSLSRSHHLLLWIVFHSQISPERLERKTKKEKQDVSYKLKRRE